VKLVVKNLDDQQVGEIDLAESVFGVAPRMDILQRAVTWQLAKRRSGTASTLNKANVSGSRAKPFKQKGTGRARQGFKRAAQMRGGGVVFGPLPRDHAIDMPKQVRKLALRAALSSKAAAGQLVVLDEAKLAEGKTNAFAKRIAKLGWSSALIIGGAALDENLQRAARNIPHLDVLPQQGINVYDILRRQTLVLTREAVQHLEERLK
jgi:large subunit ribosomal protein L4